jgi:FkbM family methyltransferase
MEMKFNFNKTKKVEPGHYIVPEIIGKDVCLDLGPCLGGFMINNKDRFKKFYCIEANHENFVQLLNNINTNNINANAFNFAVSDKTGEIIPLYIKGKGGTTQTNTTKKVIVDYWEGGPGCDGYMNCFTISYEDTLKYLGIEHIDYVKCDVEGSEYEYFIDKDLSNIDCLSIELHWFIGKEKRNELISHIEKYFYLHEQTIDKNARNVKEDFSNANFENTYINKRFKKRNH